MSDDLAEHDPALDPSPKEIRERAEREAAEVRREAQDDEAALQEHAKRHGAEDPDEAFDEERDRP